MTAVTITQITPPELEILIENTFKRMFKEVSQPTSTPPAPEQPKDVNEAAAFLKLSPTTLYGLTSRKEISFTKKGKKHLFFEEDLNNYLESGKHKSKRDLQNDVEEHLGSEGEKKLPTSKSHN
jgi:excisionase family DNA binding protein